MIEVHIALAIAGCALARIAGHYLTVALNHFNKEI